MLIILWLLTILALFFLSRNLFILLFSMENYNIHRKRLKQLQFQNKKKEADVQELIDKVTKPVIAHVFSRFKPKNLEQLERDLKMAKWDKYFTPIQYRAFNLTLKVLGVVLFLLLSQKSLLMGLIWGVALLFGMDFLFKNSIKNRKEKLLSDFPDFIRITEGYLTANVPFSQAVSESIKYVGEEWKPILQNFVIEADIKSIEEALEGLKRDVDLFEVREFVALVKLTLEQGGGARESFSAQAEKIREMQLDMMEMKIGKRKTMGIIIQGPLLLCNILVFGLPTISSMTSFTSM